MIEDPLLKWSALIRPSVSTACLLWKGATDGKGYAKVGLKGKYPRVTHLVYTFHKGVIPPDLYVLHSCDTKSCVNPQHLWLGTQSDNMKDMYNKGRRNCVSVEDAEQLRLGNVSIQEIADKYGFNRRSVWRVYKGLRRQA